VTKGNIAKLAATALVALIIVLLSVRTMGYRGEQCNGGEGVSQSPLKDQAFSTFLDQNPPFELPEKGDFAFDKSLSRPMVRHRQQCRQATSERQIAVAPLSLIAVRSRSLMVAHPGSGPALQFPSAVDVTLWRGCPGVQHSILVID
jgi:hypothetical protein